MKRVIVTLTLAAALCACSKSATSDGPDCNAVADKVIELLKADMGKLSDPQRKALGAQMATIRSEIIEDCKKDPEFFAQKAECIKKAASTADLDACENKGSETE